MNIKHLKWMIHHQQIKYSFSHKITKRIIISAPLFRFMFPGNKSALWPSALTVLQLVENPFKRSKELKKKTLYCCLYLRQMFLSRDWKSNRKVLQWSGRILTAEGDQPQWDHVGVFSTCRQSDSESSIWTYLCVRRDSRHADACPAGRRHAGPPDPDVMNM